MYRRFLDTLARINPQLKVIGFTATPYRLDSGMLHEGKDALFTDIAYEVSVPAADRRQGYLCPLVSKAAETELDVAGVGTRGGEFIARPAGGGGRPAARSPRRRSTRSSGSATSRGTWLAFCAGVEHARHVARRSGRVASPARRSSATRPKPERDRILAAFKRGEIGRCASMGVLTTGFNAPGVDLIAMLRPTKSTGLYVQMVGRGTRLAAGQGGLPGARLRRQRRPARADRRGEAEAAGQPARARRRSRSARTARASSRPAVRRLPRLRPRLPAAEGAGRARRPRRSRSSTTGKPQWLRGRRRHLPRATRSPAAARAAGRLPVRPRRGTASGSASSTPASRGRRRCAGGAAAPATAVPATVHEALALVAGPAPAH